MPKFDILFLDIDGTTIGSDHFSLSPRNRAALLAAKEAGVKLSICTGRCLRIVPQQLLDVGFDYAITSNGAAVQDMHTDTCLHRSCMTVEEAAAAYGIIRRHVSFIEWFAYGEILLARDSYAQIATKDLPPWHVLYFSQGNTPVVDSVEQYLADGVPGLEKIALVRYSREIIGPIRAELAETGLFNLTSSIGRSLEVVPTACTKGAGIRALCEILQIDPRRCAACGDGNNDLAMFETVGVGAAVGNARPELKALATCVVAPYDQDGVAEFIEQHVL